MTLSGHKILILLFAELHHDVKHQDEKNEFKGRMDGEESKTKIDSEPEAELCTASGREDSAVSSMTSEDGEVSDPEPDELDMKIRNLMSRMDLNANKNGTCEDDDEGFSSLSRSTLNTFGSQMVVGDNDVFADTAPPKQKYSMNNGFNTAPIKRTKSVKDDKADEKRKRRLSEQPERRLSRLGSFMKKLSRSKSEPSSLTDMATSTSKRKISAPDKHITPGSVMRIQVESLPQIFYAKYLGSRLSNGVWGPEHTRAPVDSMMRRARSMPEDDRLPMVKVIITHKGKFRFRFNHYRGDFILRNIQIYSI